MASQAASDMRLAYKVQSGLGTPASGASGKILPVRPGSGGSLRTALIQSRLLRGDGMTLKPRLGSQSAPVTYDSELIVAGQDELIRAVMRTAESATFNITNSDITNMTITGTGTVLTGGSGSFLSLGVRAGMFGKFASMSVAGNNAVWFPILAVTATVLTVPTGFLADNASDAAFTLTIAKSMSAAATLTERYFTCDEYLQTVDISKLLTDVKFNGLRINQQPDEPAMIGFDGVGRQLDLAAAGSSPSLTSPTDVTGNPLYLADGALYINGSTLLNITGLDISVVAPATTVPIVNSRLSPDVFLGNAVIGGSLSGTIEDDTLLNMSLNETQVSMLLLFQERETDPQDFIAFYFGDLGFGDFGLPYGGEGAAIQTLPIIGGKDQRGTALGYAATHMLISSSSAAL